MLNSALTPVETIRKMQQDIAVKRELMMSVNGLRKAVLQQQIEQAQDDILVTMAKMIQS